MLTLIPVLFLQGVFALWFYHRFKIAEATRIRCNHDVQIEKFKNSAFLIRDEWRNLWNRHELLERQLKTIKGQLYNHDRWVYHFLDKHDPPPPRPVLGKPKQ